MLGMRVGVQKVRCRFQEIGEYPVIRSSHLSPEEDGDSPEEADVSARPSLQTLRSGRTRTALLNAAETIFVRDGFEASRIEDIAAAAGRSRGAFYANFESKTEVFLALRSLATRRRARELRERLMKLDTETERFAAAQGYMLEAICDSKTLLLQIEFKLFALRHPEMLPELVEKHLEASTSINREELSDMFPEKDESLEEHRRHTLAIEAMLEGFALNALFSASVLDVAYLERLIPKLFADILDPPTELSEDPAAPVLK
jgi:AcrR family transcriptional regulator